MGEEKVDVKSNVVIFRFFLVIILFGLVVIALGHSLTIYQTNVNYLVVFDRNQTGQNVRHDDEQLDNRNETAYLKTFIDVLKIFHSLFTCLTKSKSFQKPRQPP